MSLPAIMKHLDVLSDAGLITRSKTGRTVTCQLTPAPMEQAMELARPLRALLDRAARPPRRIPGGRSMATKPSLVLKRRLKAAPEKVYEAWTKPEQMTRWWGVTGGPKPPVAETDLRVGGRFRVQFWDPKNEHHSVSGVYREVVPNRKLVLLVGVAEHARA